MMRNWIAAITFGLMSVNFVNAYAKDLPDFTELAEKHGSEVVNISVTQNVHAEANPFQGFPGMPDDDQMQEFFKRFGIPGVPGGPGAPGQPPADYKTQSLGSGFIIS